MIGDVARDRLVTGAGARPGDALLLAGPIAVEGTGILAREYAEILRARGVPEASIVEGSGLLDDPGISVLPAVRALMSETVPHAMHDPTEGGVLSSLRELAVVADLGLRVEADRILVLPACRAICDTLGLDPLGLLASGSLLAAVAPEDTEVAQQSLAAAGIGSSVIGEALPQTEGMVLVRDGVEEPLPEVGPDELARWVDSMS
jgi:hydrogenase maturation factor